MSFEDIVLISIFVLPILWCILPQKRADKIKIFIRRHKLLKGVLVLLTLIVIIGALYMAVYDDMIMTEGLKRADFLN